MKNHNREKYGYKNAITETPKRQKNSPSLFCCSLSLDLCSVRLPCPCHIETPVAPQHKQLGQGDLAGFLGRFEGFSSAPPVLGERFDVGSEGRGVYVLKMGVGVFAIPHPVSVPFEKEAQWW